jgi:hypothetical protein
MCSSKLYISVCAALNSTLKDRHCMQRINTVMQLIYL